MQVIIHNLCYLHIFMEPLTKCREILSFLEFSQLGNLSEFNFRQVVRNFRGSSGLFALVCLNNGAIPWISVWSCVASSSPFSSMALTFSMSTSTVSPIVDTLCNLTVLNRINERTKHLVFGSFYQSSTCYKRVFNSLYNLVGR